MAGTLEVLCSDGMKLKIDLAFIEWRRPSLRASLAHLALHSVPIKGVNRKIRDELLI